MKTKVIGLLALTFGVFLGVKISNDRIIVAQENNNTQMKSIFEDFYNDGYYIKDTQINLSLDVNNEIEQYFHSSLVSLERTTYYEGNSLWMNNENGINSGYCIVNNENINNVKICNPNAQLGDMAHFYKLNKENKYDYTVDKNHPNWVDINEDGMEGFYITLKDIIEDCNNADWTYDNNIYTTTNDKIIEYFKLFTAPLWLGEDSNGDNYIIFTKASIEVVNDELIMKLYTSEIDSYKLTSQDLVFSQANIKRAYKIQTVSKFGNISYPGYNLVKENSNLNIKFTPNDSYTLLSYTLTDKFGSKEIAAYNHTSAEINVNSNTTITANFVKSFEYTSFNYCNGNSTLYYYVDGKYKNYTYSDVIGSIKDAQGNPIDSSIFSVEPITTFSNGKWINMYYTKNGYGLSLYSDSTTGAYSGVIFNSTKTIHNITITYYSNSYPSRALVKTNDNEIIGHKENDTTYSYLVKGNNFSITNVSGGNYLYIPSIEIVYSDIEYFDEPITIKYDANGGIGAMENQIVSSSKFTLNENQFKKDGFIFVGWSTTPDGEVVYKNNELIDSITKDTTLYAIYEFESSDLIGLIKSYTAQLSGNLSDIYAYYGGKEEHDICRYIPNFDPVLTDLLELQFGKIVYVGNVDEHYRLITANSIPISQSYKNASNITTLDAYYELAYLYYYQGLQIQYDQGSSYQRKIRDMKPEDATELYQKYMDCSTYISNSFYNAFGEVVIDGKGINSITTAVLINFARDNPNSNEVILYQDNLLDMTQSEKDAAFTIFKNTLQPGDLYVYRHGVNSESGHVMLYLGNGYFLHSTGSSYDYDNLKDKEESYSGAGSIKTEGSVRYQSASSTVFKSTNKRYPFYVDSSGTDSNTRYAILRPLNRTDLKLTNETIARCMASGLDIEKSADKTTSVSLGDTITYTIKITNQSSKVINNISITDKVADYTTFSSMSSSYYYNKNGTDLIWNIPFISAGQTISVNYTVTVTNDSSNIGMKISSTGQVGHIKTNTLNMSISSLNNSQLSDLVSMALQYYGNSNVSYSTTANNSTLDPTNNVVTFNNDANFVTAVYNRYYASLGKTLNLSSELDSITNSNFMDSIMSTSGVFNTSSKLYSMMVHGGFGGTVFTKNYDMDRMRTVKYDYLLPGDIISFNSSSETKQYLYLGDAIVESISYDNAMLVFTNSSGVNMIHGSESDELLDRLIGYKRFAIIRPSLYM